MSPILALIAAPISGAALYLGKSLANFVLMRIAKRAIEVRDRLREKQVLVRDRSYEIAGCVRVTVGTRDQARRFLEELREIW